MFSIEKKSEGKNLSFALAGRLDTTTAPDLEKEVKDNIEGVENLDFDFANLEYISSAGLRIILSARKKMKSDNAVVIKGASKEVRDIFEMTGFSSILDVSLL